MRVIWDEDDVKVGRVYGKSGIKEQWLIGYRADLSGDARYVSVSTSDGMVTIPRTKRGMAENLSRNGYSPVEYLLADAKDHK